MLNTVQGNYIALKYKTRVAVEGMGEWQIEVTNVVNTKTFKERQVIPSLMNMANVQRIEANRCKRFMAKQLEGRPSNQLSSGMRQDTSKPISRKEEGLRTLQRIFKRHLRRNFDFLQMGSIDYKRSLMIKQ